MKTLIIVSLFVFTIITLQAQETSKRNIALLPLISNGIDEASTITTESILRMELGKQNNLNLLIENKTIRPLNDNFCADKECAREIGEILGMDEILFCKLNLLGEKIIVQYILVDVKSGNNILAEQTTALNLDDLELVMKRIALSVSNKTSFSQNVEVGNIVGNESLTDLRRKSRYNFGVGFGYLFPQEGYDQDNKSFTINAYFDHEIDKYALGLMVGARQGLAINIYGNYLFSNKDVCPFIGTSVGIHWVQHDIVNDWRLHDETQTTVRQQPKELSGNGIELGVQAGLRLLHTYNVQLFINLEFIMTFNDYDDKAIVFTIGLL